MIILITESASEKKETDPGLVAIAVIFPILFIGLLIFSFIYFWKRHDKDTKDGTYEIKQPDPINMDEDRFCLGDGEDVDTKEMTKFRPSVIQNTTDKDDTNL